MAGSTSSSPPLPKRIAAQNLEHVVFPRQVGRRRVLNLADAPGSLAHSQQPAVRLPEDVANYFEWLFRLAGLDAAAYREETLHRRLSASLRAIRAGSIEQARDLIDSTPSLVHAAIGALLVGVTSFFRDQVVFEQLRYQTLPDLAAGRDGLYVWSAGCSEGAELRSLGILLDELGLIRNSYLLGTDCRAEAITTSRAGLYDAGVLNGMSAQRREKYFVGDGAHVKFHLPQAAFRWHVASILNGLQPGFWDVISFRNTAMYLKTNVTDRLWLQLEHAIRPGGILILGKAERPVGTRRLTPIGPAIYQRLRR